MQEMVRRGRRSAARDRWVVPCGLVLIAVALAFRSWAVLGGWFQFDDFAFLSRVLNHPLDGRLLFEEYGGHLMPGGFLLSWYFASVDPLDFTYPATTLLVLQLLASLGCLFMLRHLFGTRWGILPPLCVYLFSVISLPAFIWWAAGINQLPLQIAFFWGITAHVSYLRTARLRYVFVTAALIALSLLFYEKALLVYGALAILTLSYFATGTLRQRVSSVVRDYWPAVVVHVLCGAAYLTAYGILALNFSPNRVQDAPLLGVARNYVADAFATGIVGGPLQWEPISGPFQVAAPGVPIVLLAVLVIAALLVHIDRVRERSRRAWLIPAWFLLAGILLVLAARAVVLGPIVALEYRYQTELPAAVALALGLATLPLVGARDIVTEKRPSSLLDSPGWAAGATALVSSLALVSSIQYAVHWQDARSSRNYFANVEKDLKAREGRVPLANVSVPQYLMWGYQYPENTTKYVLRMFERRTRYPSATLDELYIVDERGRVRAAGIPPTRVGVAGPDACGYSIEEQPTMIPLNGPVVGGGWWFRLAYVASESTPVVIEAGDETHRVLLEEGLHNLYFSASGRFRSISLSGVREGARLCTNDLALGVPEALAAG
ncbi:MAG: hypothetical protein ACRDPJ_22825 [Nocardioidaceae bacterium]